MLVGWEWNARVANGQEPAGVQSWSASPVTGALIQNNGAFTTPGTATVGVDEVHRRERGPGRQHGHELLGPRPGPGRGR